MAFMRAASDVLATYSLVFAIFSSAFLEAQSLSLAPAPVPPSSDGTSIDQGFAYVLMLAALLLPYIIHPLDAFSTNL